MKNGFLLVGALVVVGAATGLLRLAPEVATVHAQGVPESDVAALKAQIEALRALVPSQSHAMADVDYHFSNLWFAAQNANWPLAGFYWNETRSHLNWAVRIRPVRKLSSGQDLDLRPMLQGVENSSLAALKSAIDKQDSKAFEPAYRQTITECYACHKASEKPYLRPQVPQTPATHIINLQPKADWPN